MKLLVTIALASLAAFANPINAVSLTSAGLVQEEMHWRGWAPSGQVVEINNIHGNVRAEAAKGEEIEVIATKRGSGDPSLVSIEVIEHKGGVRIRAVYPEADSEHCTDLRVDFVVHLPKRLRFIGRTVDGDVSAHLLEQDVEAYSVQGDVRVDLTSRPGGEVYAQTGKGRVSSEFPLSVKTSATGTLACGRVGHSHRTLRLKTDAGDIHVEHPTEL